MQDRDQLGGSLLGPLHTVIKHRVSSISIALVYIPGASGDHSKSEGCTKAYRYTKIPFDMQT